MAKDHIKEILHSQFPCNVQRKPNHSRLKKSDKCHKTHQNKISRKLLKLKNKALLLNKRCKVSYSIAKNPNKILLCGMLKIERNTFVEVKQIRLQARRIS